MYNTLKPVLQQELADIESAGLYKREKRIALPILVSSVLLFYTGMAFAYFLIFPLIFKITTQSGLVGVTAMTDISKYLDFVSLTEELTLLLVIF